MDQKTVPRLLLIASQAFLVWVVTSDRPDHLPRVLAAVSLFLVFPHPMEAAFEGVRSRAAPFVLRAFRFLVLLWLFAAFAVAYFAIFNWTGPEIDFRTAGLWALAGAGFGVVVSVGLMLGKEPSSRFDLDDPADATRLGRLVFYGWPLAATAIVIGAALYPPKGGWHGIYPLFQLIFLPFLVPLYSLRAGVPGVRVDKALRLAGYPLLLVALVLA